MLSPLQIWSSHDKKRDMIDRLKAWHKAQDINSEIRRMEYTACYLLFMECKDKEQLRRLKKDLLRIINS